MSLASLRASSADTFSENYSTLAGNTVRQALRLFLSWMASQQLFSYYLMLHFDIVLATAVLWDSVLSAHKTPVIIIIIMIIIILQITKLPALLQLLSFTLY